MIGRAVTKNGCMSDITLIVAEKIKENTSVRDSDFIGTCTICPSLPSAWFDQKMINEVLNIEDVALHNLYEEFSVIENIKREYKRLKDILEERGYRENYRVINESNFIELCQKLYSNRAVRNGKQAKDLK